MVNVLSTRLALWSRAWSIGAICLALSLACAGIEPPAKPEPSPAKSLPPAFAESVPGSLDSLRAMERHVEDLVRRVSPAVVGVRIGSSVGTGVVISEDGLVLCAAHVCGAPGRPVRFWFPDGRAARGETLGTNHEMDSALIKITDPGPWPWVPVAEAGRVRIGDWVMGMGHPGGFDAKRSEVVRLGRVLRRGNLLQTDCTLISGDSGGPLFDMQGHVVAIHSRISGSLAGNFHVPIDTYLLTWDRLARAENWGNERPSTIGVRAVDAPEGCRLERVNEDGPATEAGLRAGDIVLRIDGKAVSNAEDLARQVRETKPGAQLRLWVRRGDQELPFRVKVEERRGRSGRARPGP